MGDPSNNDEPRLRCTDDRYCSNLNDRIYPQEGRRSRGFLTAQIVLHTSGEFFDLPVFYQGGGEDPPMYLNFCPFCGHDFSTRHQSFKERVEKSRADHVASGERDFIPPSTKKVKRTTKAA